jgi:hypothetical protein
LRRALSAVLELNSLLAGNSHMIGEDPGERQTAIEVRLEEIPEARGDGPCD